MKSFLSRTIGTFVLAMSALSTAANAVVIDQVQTLSFGTIGMFVNGQLAQGNTTDLTFANFDPSLGTLDSALIQIVDFNVSYEGTFTPITDAAAGRMISQASLMHPAYLALPGVVQTASFDIDETPALSQQSFFYADAFSSALFPLSNVLPASAFAVGPGEFTISGFLLTQFNNLGPGVASGQVSSYGEYSVLVRYDYTPNTAPVPVPAAAWLIGSALVSMLTLRRRAA